MSETGKSGPLNSRYYLKVYEDLVKLCADLQPNKLSTSADIASLEYMRNQYFQMFLYQCKVEDNRFADVAMAFSNSKSV